MKKIILLASSVVIGALACASSSFAAGQSLISHHPLNCVASRDYCVEVDAGSGDVHDAEIKVDGLAYGDHHEAKTLDWHFWQDGRYFAGVNNAQKNLDYLDLIVTKANGNPVVGNCEIRARKSETGIYGIVLRKNDDGSVSCVQNG